MDLSPDAKRIVAFLADIGIPVSVEPVDGPTFLSGIAIRGGGLACDPARLGWAGDLLHEAGHIAVTDPAARSALAVVADDPAEEMAAIAWSYAAAVAIGLDPRVVFHAGGYGGNGDPGASDWLAAAFADGTGPGVPMLACWGMTSAANGATSDAPAFPQLGRWLR